MTTILGFRIEHPLTRHGPWRSGYSWATPSLMPTPREDGYTGPAFDHMCAYPSKAVLYRWWDSSSLLDAHGLGLVLSTYEIAAATAVVLPNQILFVQSNAALLTEEPLHQG